MTTSFPGAAGATPRVYVLHENPEWWPPLAEAFAAEGVPVTPWPLTDGSIDLAGEPPRGVFWSRMSASSHTRGHGASKEYARAVLSWLEAHGRRVVNGRRVLELEVSKVDQLTALTEAGFDVPRTVAVFGHKDLPTRARQFGLPFIAKHNQGGKGLGVQRFDSYEEFDNHITSPGYEASPDGITLIQEYVEAAEPFITRVEFAGGEFVYAVRADTTGGRFELCPAEACAVPDPGTIGPGCLVDGSGPAGAPSLFSWRRDFEGHPLIARYRAFLREVGAEVAGIEFIETADGRLVTYDVNTNTNYNPAVEAEAPVSGPRQVARFLGDLLAERYGVAPLAVR